MCKTTPCTGTSSSLPGFRYTAASTGSRGYEHEHKPRRPQSLRRPLGCAGDLDHQHTTRTDIALPRLPAAGAVFGDGLVRGCGRGLRDRCNIVASGAPHHHVGAGADAQLHRINRCVVGIDFCLCPFAAGCSFTGIERMRTIVFAILATFLSTERLLAHSGETQGIDASWTFDPWVVIPLLVLGVCCAVGNWVLWQRSAATGRNPRGRRALAFFGSWLSLAVALVSPLHWLGEHLFSFHMIEHEILMAVSAPLLAVARPIGALLWSLPRN